MGLMDMIRGLGGSGARSDAGPGLATGFDDSQLVAAGAGAGGGAGAVMHATRAETVDYQTATLHETQDADTSIITEATASDIGAFADARDPQPAAVAEVSALPFIGRKPLATQQRILGGAVVVGLAGLLLTMFMALNSASKSAAQLNASGQALMQSQRLAKSVSQAAIGNAKAFGEVRESSDALSRIVTGLQSGDAEIAAAPQAVQEAIEPLVPLVEHATRNASVVLAHQKVLTQVGQALQAINRQSSELLRTAEGISLIAEMKRASPSRARTVRAAARSCVLRSAGPMRLGLVAEADTAAHHGSTVAWSATI